MELMTCPTCAATTLIAERNEADTYFCSPCGEWRPCYPECEAKQVARAKEERAMVDAGTHHRL